MPCPIPLAKAGGHANLAGMDRATQIAGTGDGRITAVLGPTNTGKTHLAVERMLGYSSGMIGLPLRLLAREIYDRVAAARGPGAVALITGEERIVPKHAAFYVCTVESMPTDMDVAFVAVDEIQLAADPERGHIFTQRLLRARGRYETMFLGAETMRPILRRLLPQAEQIVRARFSQLAYTGPRKLSRLPRRSAIVAFTAADVYAMAELIRRQKGGAAVVMGALSPRTRNAQVAMYQSGEVDYLVATDAIGMGLNMAIDHVAFGSLTKFDGRRHRDLTAQEIAQIAGRAGRHMNDGSFGTTAEGHGLAGGIPPELVAAVENHQFEPVKQLQWRNTELDFASPARLIASLEQPPALAAFAPAPEAVDLATLKILAAQMEAKNRQQTALLWQACQVPDFRKAGAATHARLAGQLYTHLATGNGKLPHDWVARHVAPLDRTDGGIEELSARIAQTRTWTYISHRAGWLADSAHWQDRTRAIEDKLSDALHDRLTQRFVDRRTAVLLRELRVREDFDAAVADTGAVEVEGQTIGHLEGFRFTPDPDARALERRTVLSAAARALRGELTRRAKRLAQAADADISIDEDDLRVRWNGAPVALLAPGPDILSPRLALLAGEEMPLPARAQAETRLRAWLEDAVRRDLHPLLALRTAITADAGLLDGAARGLGFDLVEHLGCIRWGEDGRPPALPAEARARLKTLGARIGITHVFLPGLFKPRPAALRRVLWSVRRGIATPPALPNPSRPWLPADPAWPDGWPELAGFALCGPLALRIERLEKLAHLARAQAGAFALTPDMLAAAGARADDMAPMLRALGYRPLTRAGEKQFVRTRRHARPAAPANPDSPFAKLKELVKA